MWTMLIPALRHLPVPLSPFTNQMASAGPSFTAQHTNIVIKLRKLCNKLEQKSRKIKGANLGIF